MVIHDGALRDLGLLAASVAGSIWAWLVSMTRLEWIMLIAGWLVWREFVSIRKTAIMLVCKSLHAGKL